MAFFRRTWAPLTLCAALGCGAAEDDFGGTVDPGDDGPFPGGDDYADPSDCGGASGVSGTSGASGVSGNCVSGQPGGEGDGDGDGEPEEPPCSLEHTFRYLGTAETVWVSGSFLDPVWPATVETGALELSETSAGKWELLYTFAAPGSYT